MKSLLFGKGIFIYGGKIMTTGYIHSIETFGLVDGPGIRFIAFMAGCALRCNFCHNPDTWTREAGEPTTPEELIKRALRYKTYWRDNGGITVSGGEPLLQMDFVTEFFKLAKEKNVQTCLDTAGQPFTREKEWLAKFGELLKYTDLILLDIKNIDNDEHIKTTGAPNTNILDMAKYLSEVKKPVWIRHVLVPGYSDNDEQLKRLHDFIETLENVEKVEVLPYHNLGMSKYEKLGIDYKLKDVRPPAEERIQNANKILETDKY
ncbi:MAG: pyruvate formate lyase-activating protein [Firmicutes bacterium]|nr:pyruvate formate lyase-activating protein [Bacillota bacterium]